MLVGSGDNEALQIAPRQFGAQRRQAVATGSRRVRDSLTGGFGG
jgi:hypothetical protein